MQRSHSLFFILLLSSASLFCADDAEQPHHIHLRKKITHYSQIEKEQMFLNACKKKSSVELKELKAKLDTTHSPRTIILSLIQNGTNINIQNEEGQTALHLSCIEKDLVLVKTLGSVEFLKI